MVSEINKRLRNATFCCFENREVVIHDNLLSRWKKEYFPFIKCISDNIPDGYSLVIVGHANRTGFEEDVTIKKKGGDALLFPGNYSYSTDRAKSLLNEMQILINSSSVVYYGAGSLSPRQDFIFNPSNGANRRITFTLMKTENSIKMKNFFDYKKKKIITK